MQAFDLAVVLSAFEPVHLSHCAALEHAHAHARRVAVVVGSARAARSLRHPWSIEERTAMLQGAAAELGLPPLDLVRVPDRLYDDAGWRARVAGAVAAAAPGAQRIAQVPLTGGRASALSGWSLLQPAPVPAPGFWDLRRAMFAEDAAERARLDASLPAATRQFLVHWRAGPHFAPLAAELRYIEEFRASWRAAPYPPILVTTDAVVVHAGALLLIQRARAPGKGLWALPGGFVDQDETLLEGCVRELHEETGLQLDAGLRDASLRRQRIFDAPHRSLRGRTITHAFRFDLPAEMPAAVQGGDDAAAARWVPLAQFDALEGEMFEDHWHIARCMLD
jgi:bifunctional NMN adenylyltransferase/nudix hydrolase